ncbi:hypothetical protein [Stenotrophomonas sp. NRRL B-14846]
MSGISLVAADRSDTDVVGADRWSALPYSPRRLSPMASCLV